MVYVSDKDRAGHGHLPIGEGVLPITTLLQQLYKYNYAGLFGVKLNLPKKDLADPEKITIFLTKCLERIRTGFADA